MVSKDFNFCLPVELSKGADDEWRIRGVASTEGVDLQGETVRQDGLDISALQAGLGLFNYDHEKGPENLLGAIDSAEKTPSGLQVEGYLFKHQPRSVAFYNILNSLKDEHKHRVKMSIEGKIIKRAGEDGKVIAKAKIDKVALTVDPVNTETYVEVMKSLTAVEAGEEIISKGDGDSLGLKIKDLIKIKLFTKTLQAGIGYTGAPTDMTGGGVITGESLEREIKDVKDVDDDGFKSVVYSMAKKLGDQFPHLSKYSVSKSIMDKVRDLNK